MKLRYIGLYDGTEPRTGKNCEQGKVYDFPDDVAKELLLSGQFEKVVVEHSRGGE